MRRFPIINTFQNLNPRLMPEKKYLEIRNQGIRDRIDGVPRYLNPWPILTQEYNAWDVGHLKPD